MSRQEINEQSRKSINLDSRDLQMHLAPRSDWSETSDDDHFVQFYESDGFLLNSLSGFIGSAINSGVPAVVVATKAHRDGLEELMRANSVDVTNALASGKYIALDAAETLSKFMIGDVPEPKRFNEVLGGVISSVTDGRSRVRAFGEMVALLWAEGNHEGALRLEELWNDLQKAHAFSLFCAYPMNGFGSERYTTPHDGVCTVHSRVLPAESYAQLNNYDDRLREIARLQQKALALEGEINERKDVEEKLRLALVGEQMARAEAETANRMKDQFLATVSHELRTPLNAIIGWSHLLKSGKLDGNTSRRAVETIDRNARSQAQLIEDILDVSRMITGKLRLNKEVVDIASVINSAIDSVQLAIESKNLNLHVTLDPAARHTVGDNARLQQVVWNLLSNAIKFTPNGGSIEINVERADANLQICVKDSGQGINPAFLPHIFEHFRQADGTTTRLHGGLGLGLAIVRQLVELHGGSVAAESPGEGLGCMFTIKLPMAPRERQVVHASSSGVPIPDEITPTVNSGSLSLQDVKVLLIDDDVDTLQFLGLMLTESHAQVHTCTTVTEGLAALEWFEPDVVVSDLAMPGEDGYTLISKLRNPDVLNSQVPAVALTSYVRVEDRTRALAAGFNMFVAKPVQPGELVAAIANLAEVEH